MPSPSRKAVVLTAILAAVTGTVAALVAVVLSPEAPPPGPVDGDPPHVTDPVEPTPPPDDPPQPVPGPGGAVKPGGLNARLSSDDEAVRYAAAKELLARGPGAISVARALSPTTSEGRVLADQVVLSLQYLKRLHETPRWKDLNRDTRLELRLKHWSRVLPSDRLRDERLEFWTARTKTNPQRVAIRAITPEQAAMAELELLRVRVELGDATREEYVAMRDERMDGILKWLAVQDRNTRVSARRRRELREQVEVLRR